MSSFNRQVADLLAMKALDKIIISCEPKMLIYDARANCIRTVSVDTEYAKRMIGKPTCLGTYDFDTRPEQIVEDLIAVLESIGADLPTSLEVP